MVKKNNRLDPRFFSTNANVVIIGAGLSGLKCAEHLTQNGFRNVKILEATERVGGRICTVKFGDCLCELGAKSIVVDQSNDSLYTQTNLKTNRRKLVQSYVSRNGEAVSNKLTEVVLLAFQTLFCNKGVGANDKYIFKDAKCYLERECEEIAKIFFKRKQEAASSIFRTLTKEFSGFMGCDLGRVYVQNLPLICQQYFNSIPMEHGMEKVVAKIQSKLPRNTVETGKPVTNIAYAALPTAICADGSLYQADHIVCTIPLGSLKNFNDYMFQPELPNKKITAISCLGYGFPCKIYMEYGEDFSSWFKYDSLKLLYNPGEDIDRSDWTNSIVQFNSIPTSTRVLEVTIGSSYCDEIEKILDEKLMNEATNVLRTFLKNVDIPLPKSVLRSNWSKNSCYLGGQPYLSLSCKTNQINELAEPIFDGRKLKLMFAGDSTVINGFGNLDGAVRSGIREAQRIIDYHNKS